MSVHTIFQVQVHQHKSTLLSCLFVGQNGRFGIMDTQIGYETDCLHSVSQLCISYLCVHKRSFVFTECALVSMVMPLRCYAYAKNNSNSKAVCNTDVVLRHDNMLPSQLRCIIISSCRNAVSATFKTQRGTCSSIMCFSVWRHKLVSAKMFSMFSAKTSDVFTFYVAWGCEKAMLNPIWPVRLKRISRNAIWIGFQTTYECSSKRICTNRISCSSLPFRLSKYDWITIGFAQKSDLGWQSERGFRHRETIS